MRLDSNKIGKAPQDKISEVAKLQENIDAQINQIRQYNDTIIDEKNIIEINTVLSVTDLLINDCHSEKGFITGLYENFALLCYEYQKLSLRCESYQIKDNLNKEAMCLQEKVDGLNKQIKIAKKNVGEIKNDTKNIVTTMLGIILAISIIPTAIVGIEKVNVNFILPFISTIILLGMIMIIFVYSIYQDSIKLSTDFIVILFMILTCVLWWMSWNWDIKLTPKNLYVDTLPIYTENIANE